MRNSLFTYCLACGKRISQDAMDVYCETHGQMAQRALGRIAWGSGIMPRLIFFFFILAIVLFASQG